MFVPILKGTDRMKFLNSLDPSLPGMAARMFLDESLQLQADWMQVKASMCCLACTADIRCCQVRPDRPPPPLVAAAQAPSRPRLAPPLWVWPTPAAGVVTAASRSPACSCMRRCRAAPALQPLPHACSTTRGGCGRGR